MRLIIYASTIPSGVSYDGDNFYNFAREYFINSELNKLELLENSLIDKENIFGIYSLARFIDIWK